MRKNIKNIIICFVIVCFVALASVFGISEYIKVDTNNLIIKTEEYNDIEKVDCIIVLGAGIRGENPSHMLEDRLLRAIELYNLGVADKIIMSGDHGKENYDEVNVMKNFAISYGVKSEDIFMDHAGFSTYETMYRAKEIFGVNRAVIVTQEYHMYRAVYIANKLGIDAIGVTSDQRRYVGESYRIIREILARDKDFVKCIFKFKPTYLGEPIPVNGNGDVTNDK